MLSLSFEHSQVWHRNLSSLPVDENESHSEETDWAGSYSFHPVLWAIHQSKLFRISLSECVQVYMIPLGVHLVDPHPSIWSNEKGRHFPNHYTGTEGRWWLMLSIALCSWHANANRSQSHTGLCREMCLLFGFRVSTVSQFTSFGGKKTLPAWPLRAD